MEKINLNEYLAANEYPGRGIAVAMIHQVEYHIGDMHFVRKYNRIGSLKVRCNLTVIAFHLQSERIDNSGNQLIGIEFLHLQRCFLPVEHRHLKHLLHLESQPLRFIIDDSSCGL